MSFIFDGAGDLLTGTLTSSYGDPLTLAVFVKVTAHPLAAKGILMVGNNQVTTPDSYSLRTTSVDDQWEANSENSAGTNGAAKVTLNIDATWAGIVGVFTNDALRDSYVQAIANTAQNTASRVVADVIKYISAGGFLSSANYFTGRIAELAIWNAALTTQQITDYLAGNAASGIAAANLIEYVPMSTNSLLNLGTDADGDLTAAGNAAFDSDHPIITSGSAKGRMLLTGIG